MSHFRYAWRTLRHAKWYSLTVILILGLALALTTTVFAIVEGVLFRPLPYPRASELVFAGLASASSGDTQNAISPAELAAWQAEIPRAAFTTTNTPRGLGNLGVVNGPTIWANSVDRAFFDVLGIHPLIGGFARTDFAAEADPIPAVISHGLWRRLLAADPAAIGREVSLGTQRVRVVGILPRHFVYPARFARTYPDVLLPYIDVPANRTIRSINVIARVPSDLPRDFARDRLTALTKARTSEVSVEAVRSRSLDSVSLAPFEDAIGATERRTFRIALAAVGALLLLVAVNVAGLSASRGLDRLRESAVRRALGASFATLVRGLAAEVTLLVAGGSVLGLAAAGPLLAYTTRLLPDNLLLLRDPVLDWRVIGLVVATAGLVAGFVTVLSLRRSRTAELSLLIGQGAGASSSRTATLGRRLLIATQVALGLVLMLGAALLVGSLWRVWQEDSGLPVERTVHLEVRPSAPRTDIVAATRVLIEALGRTPGVEAAAALDAPFLARAQRGSSFTAPGGDRAGDLTEMAGVTAGFFRVVDLPALEGRVLSDAEINETAPLVVVSQRVARSYWPGTSAVGQTLTGRSGVVTVIGVVKDLRLMALDREPTGAIFLPYGWGTTTSWPTVIVRTTPMGGAGMAALLDTVKRVDPRADVRRARSIDEALAETIRLRRFEAFLFASVGGAGVALVGAGVLGLIAMTTARRTREVGIRMALGASPARVVRQILQEQLTAVLLGLAVGGLVSAWAVRGLTTLLYGIAPYDIRLWALAAGVVVTMAAAGALVPALRAARVSPVRALRTE